MVTNNAINLSSSGITGYDGVSTFNGSPVTQFSLLLGGANTHTISSLGVASNGQLPIGSAGANPVLATLTAGTGISITNAAGSITIATSGTGTINTLTGNSGGAISPSGGNINTLGTGSITIVGSASTLTTQLTGLTSFNVLVGAGTATITNVAPSATAGVPLISNGSSANPSFGTAVVAGGGTGATSFTANSLLLGQGTSAITALGAASNGQLPIGSGGANPVLATLTAGTGISITNAAGSITIATSGTGTINTLTGNSGGAISPSGGNINTLGTGSITIVGSASTLTTQLTGLTSFNVLVGAGTATITNVAPSATAGVPLISNGSSANPSFGTAVVAGGGTGATSFTATSLLLGQGTSAITALGAASNGQLPIGSGGANPVLATLSQGTGISIANGAGSITISSTGGGLTWTDVTASTQTMAVNNGYTSNDGATLVTFTLPATAAYGTIIAVVGKAAGLWTIAQNALQTIHYGATNSTTGTGGSLSSTKQYDVVYLLTTIANTDFTVLDSIGNLTIV